MKHPTNEQWMEFLYEEASAEARKEIASHLRECAECQAKHGRFQAGAKMLDSWRLQPELTRRAPAWTPVVKWAAAAAILFITAFAAGRLSKPAVDPAMIDAQISAALETRLNARLREFSDHLATANKREIDRLAALREQEKSAVFAALHEVQVQQARDYRGLRADLEKVAVFSDESFHEAQRKLVQLAGFTASPQN